jgi:hypothetical protein
MSLSDGFAGVGETEIEAAVGILSLHKDFAPTRHSPYLRVGLGNPFGAVTVAFFFNRRMAVGSETQDDGMRLLSKTGEEKSR